jgi:phosphoribosylaminoimidazolecarboxamide formyltransferase/IMP cyclohydrolase
MKEYVLKYGCNPNQQPAKIYVQDGELPIQVLNGRAGYINLLDALNGYQLVRELKEALDLPAAASFKHVSPAGAAVGIPLNDTLRQMYFTGEGELSPLACAYARARGADRMCSFGDFIALSDQCDEDTARLIAMEVSDGVIAPSYSQKALEILKTKRKGAYTVIQIDESYRPPALEERTVYGITFAQSRNDCVITPSLLDNVVTKNKALPKEAKRDLTVALIALKYTQSNSVCFAMDGQTIGVGAGQQSRIHCTRLAGSKADLWRLRHHEKVLSLPFRDDLGRPDRDNAIETYLSGESWRVTSPENWPKFFTKAPAEFTFEEQQAFLKEFDGVSMGSDAFLPFSDNVERARESGVLYLAQPGGSIRDQEVIEKCDELGIAMCFTGLRLFHH